MEASAPFELKQVAESPRLYLAEQFIEEREREAVLALAADPAALESRGITPRRSAHGTSFELPIDGDPLLEALRARIHCTVGFEGTLSRSFRFRRYAEGDGHPVHTDDYEIDGQRLVATAIAYLEEPARGGETRFPSASPEPILVVPRRGRLAVWWNLRPDGAVDGAADHEGCVVERGEKVSLALFLYAPASFAAIHPPAVVKVPAARSPAPPRSPARGSAPTLFLVDDGVPPETPGLLRQACEARGVGFVHIHAPDFEFADPPADPPAPGDLLFCPATSLTARRVEQHLYRPDLATFHRDPDGPLFGATNPLLLHGRAGVPLVATIPLTTADRGRLRSFVTRLGGFPLVAKIPGGSGGVGVLRLDSLAALFSFADYALSLGQSPLLSSFVEDAEHLRLVVVGERVVAAYRNPVDDDDFRTHAGDERADYRIAVTPAMVEAAVAATRSLRLEHAGVDLLARSDGALFVLEANFPCYFPQAQLAGGVDVAGAMIDHLLEKSAQIVAAAADRPVARTHLFVG